jgi:hypothetical protein
MPPEANGVGGPDPRKGLPPVVAPSGRFIAQLFLVPGLIVAGAVAVLLGFSWLAGGPRTPDAFVRDLQSPNPDIRWRAANDLAQVLKRDAHLASDPAFGLVLADLLHRAVDELNEGERDLAAAGQSTAERAARERKEAQDRRDSVQYLAACVGSLRTPAGGPVLAALARHRAGSDPKADAQLRRQAVWALATLGHNLQSFDELPEDRRTHVLTVFDRVAGYGAPGSPADDLRLVLAEQSDWVKKTKYTFTAGPGEVADWARAAAAYLRKSGPTPMVAALLDCADADDPFLRRQTALALTFWHGTADENRRIEAALARLARDDGHGTPVEVEEKD